MGRYHAQVILQPQSGNPEDVQVNGLACGQIATLDLTYATNWVSAIADMYDDLRVAGAMQGIAEENHLVKIYDIEAPTPNYPLFELPFDLGGVPGGVQMPMEVALCISYANVSATTIPRARRRGRIYISGWTEAANSDGRPSSSVPANALAAFTDYVVAFNALGTLDASIWSRTNNTTYPIETAWVDNEWDTMRSRGGKSTSRATWTLP